MPVKDAARLTQVCSPRPTDSGNPGDPHKFPLRFVDSADASPIACATVRHQGRRVVPVFFFGFFFFLVEFLVFASDGHHRGLGWAAHASTSVVACVSAEEVLDVKVRLWRLERVPPPEPHAGAFCSHSSELASRRPPAPGAASANTYPFVCSLVFLLPSENMNDGSSSNAETHVGLSLAVLANPRPFKAGRERRFGWKPRRTARTSPAR